MTKLYLVRHGETEENRNGRLCGWSDVPLNDIGKIQAKKLGKVFKSIKIDVIYTSSLKRTMETVKYIVGDSSFPIYPLEDLREVNFGEAEGLTVEEAKGNYPQVYKDLEKDHINIKFPKGESLQDLHLRVTAAIDDILQQHIDKSILLIAHSGVIRSIISHLITGDIRYHWNFKIDHCSITIIEKHKDFSVLTKLNDTCHLNNI